ncbi:tetratricopeptide repeat protein [bacterium]|nr:tetratricopeptide repeat protein [bacterium]
MSEDGRSSARIQGPRTRAKELYERGYSLQLEGRVLEAERCYRESIELVPTAEAHTFLAWALAHEGKVDEAIEQCREAIRLDPAFGNAWSDIAAYLIEKGEDAEAETYLRRALESTRFERHHYVHENMGRVHWKQGLLMKALAEFRLAFALEPRDVHSRKAIREILRNFN